jgi:hypothetical protein
MVETHGPEHIFKKPLPAIHRHSNARLQRLCEALRAGKRALKRVNGMNPIHGVSHNVPGAHAIHPWATILAEAHAFAVFYS